MLVEIWSDVACPWCHVGKRRWERALADFPHRAEVEVAWRSFELDPRAPARHREPQAELLARKYGTSRAQAEAMNARMTAEAAREGLEFHLDRVVVGNTFDAHRLLHESAQHGLRDRMVERLFVAYLSEGEALGEHEVLVRLAAGEGLDADAVRAMLASDRHAAAVRDDGARARRLGITGVPFFVLDGRLGVSGAQPPEVLLAALTEAWEQARPALRMVGEAGGAGDADAACGPEGCPI